jgi:26S proteasome regulatory subunit N3
LKSQINSSISDLSQQLKMVASQDVEMEVVETVEDPETVKKDADASAVQEIREHIKQIEKAVSSKEPRFILRVLRGLPNTRRKLNPVVLRSLASQIFPAGSERDAILVYVENLPAGSVEPEVPKPRAIIKTPIPEVDAYYHLLALVRLLDSELLDKASVCGE